MHTTDATDRDAQHATATDYEEDVRATMAALDEAIAALERVDWGHVDGVSTVTAAVFHRQLRTGHPRTDELAPPITGRRVVLDREPLDLDGDDQ